MILGVAYPVVFSLPGLSADSKLVLSDIAAFGSAAIGATAATVAGLRKTQFRIAWRWIAAGLWLWALGEGTWAWVEVVQDSQPFPSLADAFYVPAYIGLLVGVLMLSKTSTMWTRARAIMDALLFTFAAAVPLWRHVLLPIFQDPASDILEQGLAVFYPVGDLVLLLALGILVARQFPLSRRALLVFAVGLAASLAADIGFAVVGDSYEAGSLIDFLWFASFLIMAAAAIMELGDEVEAQQAPTLGVWQNALPVLTLVPLAIWAVYSEYTGNLDDSVTPLLLGLYGIGLAMRQVVEIFDFRAIHGDLEAAHDKLGGLYGELQVALVAETELARRDQLTGQLNRQGIMDELDSMVTAAAPFSLAMADLDGLKAINDAYGHSAGDAVMKQFAALTAAVPDSQLGRYGGDEFVLLTMSPVREQLEGDLDAVRKGLRDFVTTEIDRSASCSASFGVAYYPEDGDTISELLSTADSRMYEEKQTKHSARLRDIYRKTIDATPPTPQTQEGSIVPHIDLRQLEKALAGDQFEVYFQPITQFPTGNQVGFEALVRWRHPTAGILTAGQFISVAERSAFIHRLGARVLLTSCQQVASWLNGSPYLRDAFVSVNVSARQIRRAFIQEVFSSLEVSHLHPGSLVLEITESAVLSNSRYAFELLAALQGIGVKIALDDFGLGYSSINYLRSFPFDIVKLDPTFVRGVVENGRERTMVAGIIDMAHGLGARIVAEGIETSTDLEALTELDFDYAQGYLFGHAVPGLPALPSATSLDFSSAA